MKNYWVIGDIHGELHLLDRLLKQVLRFDPEQLVFVGDYVDRGSQSREVVDRLMGLGERAICLMGNHEMMMLNALAGLGFSHNPVEHWYYNGGEATIQSFGHSSFFSFQSELDAAYLKFFRGLHMAHEMELGKGQRVLVCHAGVSPFVPVEDMLQMPHASALVDYLLHHEVQLEDSFLWVREAFFNASPDLWEGRLVVHGHTPVNKLQRFVAANGMRKFHFVDGDLAMRKDLQSGHTLSVDVDSGSVISGRLSALGFFEEQGAEGRLQVRMRSMTVSREELFPRDLGILT
jgi:serine/threonine protein phosphatase 1